MVKNLATWAVVATVDEPPALVQAFVAWHLALGASQVFIYCDRPDDPVQGMLAHLANVTVVGCDAAHWLRVGKSRPRRHEVRQVRNARDADARAKTDWILHCDADEFVWAGVSVQSALAGALDQTDCLVLPVAERNGPAEESIFDGAFRRPYREPHKTGRALFGPDYDLTYRGLTGHAQGKAFMRRGRSLRMSIHRPHPSQSDTDVVVEHAQRDALELLHFEGLTAAHWVFKLSRMIHALAENDGMPPSKHRHGQADALIADPVGGIALYHRLKCPGDAGIALLKRYDLWVAPAFDPSAALQRYFPDQSVDLAPQAVDAWLRHNKAHVLSYLRSE